MAHKRDYITFEEMSAIARLEDLHRLGFPGYFVNCLGHIYACCHKAGNLTHISIKEISAKYKTGNYTHDMLSKEYGVSQDTIAKIVNNSAAKYYYKIMPRICREHYMVGLWHMGKQSDKKCGTLVLEAFVGPRPSPEHECCHGDKGKLDDSLDNVYWGTKSQNQLDRIRDGTDMRGEKHPNSKLIKDNVIEIRLLWENGVDQDTIAKRFNIRQATVSGIVLRKSWKHV